MDNPSEHVDEVFNDTKGASRFLNIPERTLERWRYEGCGPRFAKFGKSVRYPLSELKKFVTSQLRTSTSDTGKAA